MVAGRLDQALSPGALRELAGQLADDLAGRGLVLGDVERLAPLLLDRFRLSPARTARIPDARGAGGRSEGLPALTGGVREAHRGKQGGES